jgi:hypothetical protein
MKINTTMLRLGELASVSLIAAIAIVSGGAAAHADPSLSTDPTANAVGEFHAIRNVGNADHAGLCLQPDGGSTGEVAVVQKNCDGSEAQSWLFQSVPNGFHIVNQHSGLCLNLFGPSANGTEIAQIHCVNVSNELWTVSTLSGITTLRSRVGFRDSGLCVDVPGQSGQDGLPVQSFQCNGTVAQQFFVGL